jgi:precorrin-6B methylase 2
MTAARPNSEPVLGSLIDAQRHPSLGAIVGRIVGAWPDHRDYLAKSLGRRPEDELAELDALAGKILKICPDPAAACASYRWMCGVFIEEDLHFRRTGEYRCKTFAEAKTYVYDNEPFMHKYMDGLLVSQLLWANHANSYLFFLNAFVRDLPDPFDYLEIGPGHGLYLSVAALDPRRRRIEGWDVSAKSLSQTQDALRRLGVERNVCLRLHDVLAEDAADDDGGAFDAIVISEVLEHLENPERALARLARSLRPGGRLFVNVPINSPAPDHIYLLRSADEARRLMESSGLAVVRAAEMPMTGYTLAQAAKARATVSCLFVLHRSEAAA